MKDKETKRVIRWVLSLMVIAVLFIPALAVYEIEARTETRILAVEGLYINGTAFPTYEPVDKTQIKHMYSGETVILNQANNDSYYLGFPKDIAYTNFLTYIGNNTNTVIPNYTIQSAPYEIVIPLNISTHELASYDFLRLYSTDEHTSKHLFYNQASDGVKGTLIFTEIRNNTYILILTLSTRTHLLSVPNEKVYLAYRGLDILDISWNFKAAGFNLDAIHQFTWSDNQMYIVSLLIVAGIITPLAILSSKWIDLKLDKGKPGGSQ